VRVRANNWLDSLAKAAAFFEFDTSGPVNWTLSSAEGVVEVAGPDGVLWTIAEASAELQIQILGHVEEDFPLEHKTTGASGQVFRGLPPMITMPGTSIKPENAVFSRHDLSEHLFEMSGDIAGKPADEAAHVALGHIHNFVAFSDALVVKGSLDDTGFAVILGQGELGEVLIGHEVPFDVGVLGQCHANHMAVWLTSVTPQRLSHLPDRVHPLIESLLAVPVVADDGWFWGVLHLLNISPRTDEAAVEAAGAIARTLANALRG